MDSLFLVVNKKLQLHWPKKRYAETIFKIVEKERAYLRTWLPWVDYTTKVGDTKDFLKESIKFNKNGQRLTTFIQYEEELVGSIGFVKIDSQNKKGEIGYWLRQDCQGRGIMTTCCAALIKYAFTKLQLNRLEIRTHNGNAKSQAIPRRLGFQHEGTLRESILLYDTYKDELIFSLLKKDWEGIKEGASL